MWSLDSDLDAEMSSLEAEWSETYEASIVARSEYQALAADPNATCDTLDAARERLDRAEARKSRIMTKIERLQDRIVGGD